MIILTYLALVRRRFFVFVFFSPESCTILPVFRLTEGSVPPAGGGLWELALENRGAGLYNEKKRAQRPQKVRTIMEPIYVMGHRNPDTDSIVSAMAYAALRNAIGDREYVAARLGHVSDETQMVLKKFGFEPPVFVHNVRNQVCDLAYDTPPVLNAGVNVSRAWDVLRADGRIAALPVTDDDGHLYGMLSPGDIASYDMQSIYRPHVDEIPLFNLISALEGRIINEAGDMVDTISGDVVIALPQAHGCPVIKDRNAIVICGQQDALVREAIEAGVRCVILCQAEPDEAARSAAGTCVITTSFDAYRAARMIYQSIPISRICRRTDLISFRLRDYIDDVRELVLKSRYRSYPILDDNDSVVGTLSRFHLIRPKRKRVVLVDHNEAAQSVPGLEEAEILEIIDHHRLADIQTSSPIYFRNEPVGCTATIVAGMYQEKGLVPSEKLAGLMAAAIVSDTVMFKSPTCTERDRRVAERLARIAGISLEALGREIFSVAASDSRPADEILTTDFKDFHIAGHNLGIGQVTCLNSDDVLRRKQEFLDAMDRRMQEKDYDMMILMLTDVLKDGTEIIYRGDEETIRQAFNVPCRDNAAFLPGVMSRKKQVIPMLSVLWG